MTRYAKVRYIE